jgi:hypothetical protein
LEILLLWAIKDVWQNNLIKNYKNEYILDKIIIIVIYHHPGRARMTSELRSDHKNDRLIFLNDSILIYMIVVIGINKV